MKWLILVILLLVALLVWQFFRKRFGVAIIRMRVGSDQDDHYQVVIEELQPTKRSAEFVRILLGSAAGMLYWSDQKGDQREAMRKAFLDDLNQVGRLELTPQYDLATCFEEGCQVVEVAKLTVRQQLKATLHYQNLAYRYVNTQSLKTRDVKQLRTIWLAMLAVSLKKWDQKLVDRFQGALRAMVDIYRDDHDYLTMQSVIHYPNRAFLQHMTGTDASR